MDSYFVVVLPNRGEVPDPRRTFDRCEAIWIKHGKSAAEHRALCGHCCILVGACHDCASLHEALMALEPIDVWDNGQDRGFEVVG